MRQLGTMGKTIPIHLAASLALTCCGSSSDSQSSDKTASATPHMGIPIDPQWQQTQLQACMKRMDHYQQAGVWKHGGAAPGVDRAAWNNLSDAEKTEVFQIAACIGAAGIMQQMTVTVSEEGKGPEIETRTLVSSRDFTSMDPQ